jgi:hypothetical protein
LEIAAKVLGTLTPSSPFSGGGGIEVVATPVPEVIVAIAGAPVICVTASTLPTRSTTAIVAGAPSALAWFIAWRITVFTSLSVKFKAGAGAGVEGGGGGGGGGGDDEAAKD